MRRCTWASPAPTRGSWLCSLSAVRRAGTGGRSGIARRDAPAGGGHPEHIDEKRRLFHGVTLAGLMKRMKSNFAVTRLRRPPQAWDRLKLNKVALAGVGVVVVVALVAILAPWLAPYDPAEQFAEGLSPAGEPFPPAARFWLGTDLLGRDLLSRLIYGARVSLLIGVVAHRVAPALRPGPGGGGRGLSTS